MIKNLVNTDYFTLSTARFSEKLSPGISAIIVLFLRVYCASLMVYL